MLRFVRVLVSASRDAGGAFMRAHVDVDARQIDDRRMVRLRRLRTEREMVMDLIVDLYWSFRSPYSYIVLPRIIELRDKFRVSVDLRIVHPAAIRNPSYFERMDPLARPYFLKDSARAAAFHGLKFRRPVPDPIEQDPNTLAIANGAAPRSTPRSPRDSGQRAGARARVQSRGLVPPLGWQRFRLGSRYASSRGGCACRA